MHCVVTTGTRSPSGVRGGDARILLTLGAHFGYAVMTLLLGAHRDLNLGVFTMTLGAHPGCDVVMLLEVHL